jgi:hypothetical protein
MMMRVVAMNPLNLLDRANGPVEQFPSPHPMGRGIKGEGLTQKNTEVTL